ncbi:MAG TPA: ribose 5-phosphate isomerase B [Polyangiaceae bacterium]
MKVAIGGDHAGFDLKRILSEQLVKAGHDVKDFGTDTAAHPSDYPDFAKAVGEAVAKGEVEKGVLVCGSGVGVAVAANKVFGVRAALCHDTYSAHQGVEHDDMNVICLGARIVGQALAGEIVEAFTKAKFSNEERHVRRLEKTKAIEREYMKKA